MEQYLISSMNKTHKFTHAIAVIVRRSKGMFSNQPSWREYDKIKQCDARFIGWCGQNCNKIAKIYKLRWV